MAFCDWLQYTVKSSYVECRDCLAGVLGSLPWPLQDLIGYHSEEYSRQCFTTISGVNFYRQGVCFDCGLKVFFDGLKENMGTNIVISGDVLKMVNMNEDDFKEWFEKVLPHWDINVSRCDFAIDTDVDFSYFLNKVNASEIRTKYRTIKRYLDSDDRGTLYFGQRGKGTFCRIYDKYLEGIEKLKSESRRRDFIAEQGGKSWTRIEFEFRQEQALEALQIYIYDNIHSVFLGHLDFTDRYIEGHMERCKTDEVYMSILQVDFKRRVSNVKNQEYPLEWVMKVAVPQFLALQEVKPDLFDEILKKASASPSAVQKAERSLLDIYRFEKTVDSVEKLEPDKPLYIDKVLKFEEVM